MGYRFLGDYEPQKGKKKNGAQTAPRSGNSANPFAANQKKPSAQATGAAQTAQNVRTSRGTALGGSAPMTPVQMLKPTAPKLTKVSTPVQKTTQVQGQQLKLPNIQAFGAGDYSRAGKTLDRAAKAVKAGALNSAAGFTEIAAQFHPTTGEQSMGQFSGFGDLGRAVRENREKGTDINASIRQQEEQRRAQRKQSQQKMFAAADRLTEKGQQYEQEAKRGLGTVGQFLVDMGVTGTQMAGDAIANLVLPGSGLAMMGMRSYGQAAGEARKAGKSEQQQFLAGLKSAGIEVFTEKMFGAFSKVYGGAAADELIEKLVGKMTGNVTGQALLTWMINSLGEGVEEVTSDMLNPLADRLLGLDDGTGPIWSVDDLAQWGYDFLLGTAMGIVGGGTQLARGVQQGRAQTAESRYYDDLLRNGLGSAAAAENARRASDAMGRIMPARDGLRMPQLTTYEQRQAEETSRQRAATRYTAEEAAAKRKDARTFRNIIAGIDTSVSDFFERWKSGRKSHLGEKLEQLYIAPMPDNMAEEVSRIVGYHVDSRDFIVTSDDVKHVIDQHGNPAAEIAKGNIPLETWMLDALPDVVTNPDSIEPGNLGTGNKNAGKRGIVFSKAFPGGKIITIQFDNKGRGTLELNTMYAKESATLEGNGTDVPNTFTPEAAKPALSYAEKTRTSRYAMPSTQESAAPAINAQNGPPQSFSLKTSVPQAQESVNRLKMPQLTDEQGRTYEQRMADLEKLKNAANLNRIKEAYENTLDAYTGIDYAMENTGVVLNYPSDIKNYPVETQRRFAKLVKQYENESKYAQKEYYEAVIKGYLHDPQVERWYKDALAGITYAVNTFRKVGVEKSLYTAQTAKPKTKNTESAKGPNNKMTPVGEIQAPRLTTYEQRMAEQRAAEETASVPVNGPVTGPEKSYPSFDGQLMMPQVLRAEIEAEMAQKNAQNTERPAPTPEEAQAAREDADAISRATAMMDRDFAETDRQAREQQTQQEQANREMPEALKKLGVEPFGSEADYAGIDNLAKEMRWNGSARKQTQRQMNKIPATEKERTFARRLADGTLDAADIPNTVNRETVETLADFYRTLDSAPETMLLRQRRAIIMEREEAKMEPLLGMDVAYDEGGLRTNGKGDRKNSGSIAKQTSTLRRNLQTPARICATEWGPEHGKKVYEALFYPVTENNGRQIDWVNSMLDRVRTFKDSKGEERPLNRKERELVQKIVEHEGSKDRVAAFDEQYKDAVENVRNGATAEDAAKMFGIDPSYQEYQDLQNYETYLKALEDLHDSKSADDMAVGKAVDAYSKLYKELYDGINSFLVAHGYQPIGFIEGYAPHMQPEAEKTAFSKALKLLGLDDTAMSLPTSISGKTADLKPYKQYNPFFQERHGVNTEYDIAKGFEEYVYYLGNIFYHTDDIMRIRTAEKYIRKTYSSEEASEQISRAESARDFTDDQIMDFLRMSGVVQKGTELASGDARVFLEDYIGKLYDQIGNITRYSEMAKYLDNYANRLAGKQNMADRGAEAATGRGSLNWINTLTGKYGGAKLAFNVSSALNQTSQIPMVAAENGERATLHAIGDFFKSKKDRAAFVQESNFLKGKKGIDWLLGPETGWEKFKEKGFTLIEMVDSFTSYVAVRSKYLKEIKAGKSHADAMKLADEYGRNVMGSRARGEKPMLFDTKNPFWQIVTRFQLEALNSWEHVSRDLPNEVRQMAREKGKAYAAGTMGVRVAKYLTYGFLLNLGIGALSGGSPVPYDVIGSVMEALGKSMGVSKLALVDNVLEAIFDKRLFGTDGDDDDDAEKDWWAFLGSLWGDVANDIPIVGQLAALAGVGDETLPVTDLSKVGDFAKSIKNNGVFSGDTLDKGLTAASEFMFGGNQLRKTIQGGKAVAQGGVYSKSKLRYQVDQTPGNIVKGVLFGRSALNESQAYYAERTSDFSENQTEAFRQMQDRGVSAKASYDLLQELRGIEKTEESTKAERQRDALRQSSVSGAGKWVTYYQTMASEREWKTMDAMQYNSEADYGTVTSLLMDMKEQDNDADKMRLIDRSRLTDSQKAFLYKQLVAKDEDLEKINALKDAGISDYQYFQYRIATSGLTKKEAKLHAINTLDLTNSQKDALYYMNSYASSKHWEAPWEQGISADVSDLQLSALLAAEEDDGDTTPKWQQSLNNYMWSTNTGSGYERALAVLRRRRGLTSYTETGSTISTASSGYERALAVLRQRRMELNG